MARGKKYVFLNFMVLVCGFDLHIVSIFQMLLKLYKYNYFDYVFCRGAQLVKLVSAAGTGYFYVARKTKLFGKEKMILRRYDPRGTLIQTTLLNLCLYHHFLQ